MIGWENNYGDLTMPRSDSFEVRKKGTVKGYDSVTTKKIMEIIKLQFLIVLAVVNRINFSDIFCIFVLLIIIYSFTIILQTIC